jgi:choline kinase
LECLIKNNIKNIVVIAGYLHEEITRFIERYYPFVQVIVNKEYLTTNNMYSAFLAKELMNNSDFLLLNGDVFIDESIIAQLIRDKEADLIAVDYNKYYDESMKIVVEDQKVIHISKTICPEKAYGSSIDIYKFSKNTSITFFRSIDCIITRFGEKRLWNEVALDKILLESNFKPHSITGNWFEIDSLQDLEKAKEIFER